MRKIMNRTMSLLLVAIMAFSLAACGASGDNSGTAPAESKAAGKRRERRPAVQVRRL